LNHFRWYLGTSQRVEMSHYFDLGGLSEPLQDPSQTNKIPTLSKDEPGLKVTLQLRDLFVCYKRGLESTVILAIKVMRFRFYIREIKIIIIVPVSQCRLSASRKLEYHSLYLTSISFRSKVFFKFYVLSLSPFVEKNFRMLNIP